MDYKKIYHISSRLITDPAGAWEEIHTDNSYRDPMEDFVYPWLTLCGAAMFLGSMILAGWQLAALPEALKVGCSVFVSLFAGFFLSTALITRMSPRIAGRRLPRETACTLTGYSMVVIFALKLIDGLLCGLPGIIYYFLAFYTVVVVFNAGRKNLGVDEAHITWFTIITSLTVVFSPEIISTIFNKLIHTL